MILEDLIKSENSNSKYTSWEAYRNSLTNSIISNISEYIIFKNLQKNKQLRAVTKESSNIKEDNLLALKEMLQLDNKHYISNKKPNNNSHKNYKKNKKKSPPAAEDIMPSLAIWGAGNCTDINLHQLSRVFHITLIDCDSDKTSFAKKAFAADRENVICANIPFWEISNNDYKMLEALFLDSAPMEDLVSYLDHIVDSQPEINYELLPHFDYSVAAGLSSQLCSRIVALFSKYSKKYTDEECSVFMKYISEINDFAVTKMWSAILEMTDKQLLISYELTKSAQPEKDLDTYEELTLYHNLNELKNELPISAIAGNKALQDAIFSDYEKGKIGYLKSDFHHWNFADDINYIMHVISLYKTSK